MLSALLSASMSTLLEESLWQVPVAATRRHRTTSCTVEGRATTLVDRRTQSYAGAMARLPETLQSLEPEKSLRWQDKLRALPGLGILLAITVVFFNQTTNVVIKKMSLSPMPMLLWRDSLRLGSIHVPLLVGKGANPFPKGSRLIILARGLTAGVQVCVRTYAVKVLPLADYTMICSINPVFVTLLSCIFLKEACGLFEMFNLVLVLTGITLVIQPPFLFGSSEEEYTSEMVYMALGLVAVTAVGSIIPIILRHLRAMHWIALSGSSRIITVLEYAPLVLILGEQCIPACGEDRATIILLACIGVIVQTMAILSYKYEEAHIITLIDNAANIVIAFSFQALFFLQATGPVKLLGAAVVLASVFIIGGRKAWQHRQEATARAGR